VENQKARDTNVTLDGGLKDDENWMSTETSWVHDVARGHRDTVSDVCAY